MNYSELIAAEIGQGLRTAGYESDVQGNSITISHWGIQVNVVDGDVQKAPGRVLLMPSITVTHRYLPKGFVRELSAGLGETEQEAVNSIAFFWMLLFFPVLKFLFDEQPHDCTVCDAPITLARDKSQPYKLIAGPLQMVGFEGENKPEQISQTMLWNAFSDLLLPKLPPGVHHVRCYVASSPDGLKGDVFVDGEEWPEGCERLMRLARDFPSPDNENPVYALKQHLLIRPEDLAAGTEREQETQVADWAAAIGDRIGANHRELAAHVLQAMFLMGRCRNGQDVEQLLVRHGVPENTAAELICFLPSATARIFLKDQVRVQFSDTYYLANLKTRRAVERRYDQTPVFMAALEICDLLRGQKLADHEINVLASGSSEVNTVFQAMEHHQNLEGAKFSAIVHPTSQPVDGEDLDRILAQYNKPATTRAKSKTPWWKFW